MHEQCDNGGLDGRVAVVTGASRGIGAAIADHLGRAGATVVGTATSAPGAEAITQSLQAAGHQGRGAVLDVASAESVDRLFGELPGAEGPPVILVNNAGITRDGLLLRMKPEDWDVIVNTNLSGVYRTVRAALRGMMKARHGRIINVTSVVAAMGNPGQCNYAAAKAGLVGFTRSLAREVGTRGITANAVAPGFIDTDMTRVMSDAQRESLTEQIPLARLGSVSDIAAAVAFLASDQAAYITGETLNVNGGMYMA